MDLSGIERLNGLEASSGKEAGGAEAAVEKNSNAAKCTKPLFRKRKRGYGNAEIPTAYPNLMFPVSGRELAPAPGIDDPGPVAVASQGSSLSHSA
jgi:hypothetical protein